ncbi:MAG: T9SS type A sorting domain-containing protein [Cyclobacteriaceae bacterium]
MNTRQTIFHGLVFTCVLATAQTKTGDLKEDLSAYLESIPESIGNQFVVPSDEDLINWESGIAQLLNGNLADSRTTLALLNYQVTEYSDTSTDPNLSYHIVEEMEPRQFHGGIYVFTTSACSEFVSIQAPHPLYDSNTGLQAAYCFSRISSGALMIAGTHRCNSNLSSTCDGTTSACGSSEAYRQSDLAHTEQSFFHATTKAVAAHHASSVFIQLHGFGKTASDPYVIMSNGSRTTPSTDYADMLKDELDLIDPSLTFKLGHQNTDWTRLLGFTNVQGRYLNNSIDPCEEEASEGSGRFIHIEQEREKLRADVGGWETMARALANTFNCALTTGVGDLLKVRIYPVPLEMGALTVEGSNLEEIRLMDHSGKVIQTWKCSESKVTLDVSGQKSGLYLLKVIGGNSHSIHKVLLK